MCGGKVTSEQRDERMSLRLLSGDDLLQGGQEEKLGITAYLRDLKEFGKFVKFDPRTVTRIIVRAERATVITTLAEGNSDLTELHREGILWKVHIP